MLDNNIVTTEDLSDAKVLWDYHNRIDELKKLQNSVIIGLGSYDIRVAQYCSRLYLDGYGQKIVFTGKLGNWTRGKWTKSEAEIFADAAIGVPREDIWLEPEATNIGENIAYSKCLLNLYMPIINQIIVVTKPNTTRRAYATFMVHWSEMGNRLKVAAPPVGFNDLATSQTTESLISELVGDIERIITYPDKGFQIRQDIPDNVMMAYSRLKASGYLEHSL